MARIGQLLFRLPPSDKSTFRRLESLEKKLINALNAVTYNEICLKENLLPKYTNIILHSSAATSRQHTLELRRQLVKDELQEKKNVVDSLLQ